MHTTTCRTSEAKTGSTEDKPTPNLLDSLNKNTFLLYSAGQEKIKC